MAKATRYQFETNRNSDGEYVCQPDAIISMEMEHDNVDVASAVNLQNQFSVNQLFMQSYLSNFSSEDSHYMAQMQPIFDQMRRNYLEQTAQFVSKNRGNKQ